MRRYIRSSERLAVLARAGYSHSRRTAAPTLVRGHECEWRILSGLTIETPPVA